VATPRTSVANRRHQPEPLDSDRDRQSLSRIDHDVPTTTKVTTTMKPGHPVVPSCRRGFLVWYPWSRWITKLAASIPRSKQRYKLDWIARPFGVTYWWFPRERRAGAAPVISASRDTTWP
jgi:hypothetical protein